MAGARNSDGETPLGRQLFPKEKPNPCAAEAVQAALSD
jgi:hypothetical protein